MLPIKTPRRRLKLFTCYLDQMLVLPLESLTKAMRRASLSLMFQEPTQSTFEVRWRKHEAINTSAVLAQLRMFQKCSFQARCGRLVSVAHNDDRGFGGVSIPKKKGVKPPIPKGAIPKIDSSSLIAIGRKYPAPACVGRRRSTSLSCKGGEATFFSSPPLGVEVSQQTGLTGSWGYTFHRVLGLQEPGWGRSHMYR